MNEKWSWVDYGDPADKPLISERTVAWIIVVAFFVGMWFPWDAMSWNQ